MAVKLLATLTNLAGIGKKYLATTNSKIGNLVIDATYDYTIKRSNTITDHPIESPNVFNSGSYIADNVYRNPLTISLRCAIINSPIGYLETAGTILNIFSGDILQNVKSHYQGKGKNIIAAYEILNDMIDQATIVSVSTKLEVIDNLIVEDIEYIEDNTTFDALAFRITLKQVAFAESATIDSSFFSNLNAISGFKDSISSKLNLGSQVTKNLNSAEISKSSAALNVYNYITGGK
jgi:hypothetical protein